MLNYSGIDSSLANTFELRDKLYSAKRAILRHIIYVKVVLVIKLVQ